MKNLKKRKKYTGYNKLKFQEIIILIPIIFIVLFYPYIMGYQFYYTNLSEFSWFSLEDSYFDLFLYYKQLYLVITGIVMLIVIGYYVYKQKFQVKLPSIFIPVGVYALLALVSTVASEYSFYGYRGMFEQFESVFVLLCYSITVVYVFIVIKKVESIEPIFKCLTISVIGFGMLGLTQILGFDFLTSEFGLKLILPRELWSNINKFQLAFYKSIYLTLYNPNYVGVYTGFLLPLYVTLLIIKGKKGILYYLLPIASLTLCLIGSKSASGVIGIVIAAMFTIILLRQYIFKKNRINVAIIIIAVISIVFMIVPNFEAVKRLLTPQKAVVKLTDIQTKEEIIVTYNKHVLYIDYFINEEKQLVLELKDQDKKNVEYVQDSSSLIYKIVDERFSDFSITPILYKEQIFISLTIEGKEWSFTKAADDTYYYYNKFRKLDKIETAEFGLFTGYERFASGRGYIWSRTLPLLKRYVILGSGADTFAIVFPQRDYVNLYHYGFGEQVLTKPHSMYLQIGVQTGVVSLIAFLTMYGIYFVSSIKLYIRGRINTKLEGYGVACFISSISYMVVGISNDSSLTIAPIYWVLIGLGIRSNYLIMKEKAKE